MSKINKDNLGYLGVDFQHRLLLQMIIDTKFGESIVDILKPNYFEDTFLRSVSAKIKDNFDKYEVIPDMNSLESIILETVDDDIDKKLYQDKLQVIKDAELNNSFRTQDIAMKFCKQQELKKSVREIQKIIERGDLEDYHKCEEILKKALEVGDNRDDGLDVFDNIENVLKEDYRDPISTGIDGLDEIMDGGLAKGEFALIVAPTGVGKTTLTTKLVNSCKNQGRKVLQIFFEDNYGEIQRKHIACWMDGKYNMNELEANSSEIFEVVGQKENEPGEIKLKKFPSGRTTVGMIRQYIKKLIAQGFKPDLVTIDYVDCIQPSKDYKESWSGEGEIMRDIETLLHEMNIAGWACTQGNRGSLGAEKVESSMIGGSIKKAQICHFIISVAKTDEQKVLGTANLTVLKSRFGKDGITFEDITFDNGTLHITMEGDSAKGRTFLESREKKVIDNQNRVNELMDAMAERKKREEEERQREQSQ